MATKKKTQKSTRSVTQSTSKSSSKGWQAMMEEWFLKLPPLSKSGRDVVVNITPWVALVFGILGVLAGLAGFGLLTAFSPFMALSNGFAGASGSLISAALYTVSSVLLLVAFPGTKNQTMQGWNMLFWSEIINTLGAIVSVSLTGIVFAAVGFYLLYQIKSYYK